MGRKNRVFQGDDSKDEIKDQQSEVREGDEQPQDPAAAPAHAAPAEADPTIAPQKEAEGGGFFTEALGALLLLSFALAMKTLAWLLSFKVVTTNLCRMEESAHKIDVKYHLSDHARATAEKAQLARRWAVAKDKMVALDDKFGGKGKRLIAFVMNAAHSSTA